MPGCSQNKGIYNIIIVGDALEKCVIYKNRLTEPLTCRNELS
jgi:hypothetical protein